MSPQRLDPAVDRRPSILPRELDAPSGTRRWEPVIIRPADTVELPPRDGDGMASASITCGVCEPTLLWQSIAFQMFFMRISEFQAVDSDSRSYAFFSRSALRSIAISWRFVSNALTSRARSRCLARFLSVWLVFTCSSRSARIRACCPSMYCRCSEASASWNLGKSWAEAVTMSSFRCSRFFSSPSWICCSRKCRFIWARCRLSWTSSYSCATQSPTCWSQALRSCMASDARASMVQMCRSMASL
mmetsp:Transcript_84040/g.238412  ORF Transcript_84040/g.238412 Transcript_84040/m.238412 type:complete len:245 (-) Transcript_84040:279-1013(-)